MNWRTIVAPAILFAAPLLMAPTCANSEVSVEALDKEVYCNEDVTVRAVVSNPASSSITPSALLGLFSVTTSRATILRRVDLGAGDSIVLSATIPWSQLADHRGEFFNIVADIGLMDPDVTNPGSTLSLETYVTALGSMSNLYGRATRSFMVCE
jgi:hypothetical protein